jgi:hypothetical protein
MAKLVFDADGQRFYETGVKDCVLYVFDKATNAYAKGVAWNGITAVTETPSGAEATALYADDIKYLNLMSVEEFGATIEAYTYPDEFMACDGSAEPVAGMVLGQQTRSKFALAYKTTLGNDEVGNDYGYKLHIVYGCLAAPSEKAYATINDSPEAITFSWEVTTTPVSVNINNVEYKPTSIVTLKSTDFIDTQTGRVNAKFQSVLDALYGKDPSTTAGTDGTDPTLKMPAEIYALLSAN